MSRDPGEVHPSSVVLDEEQNVQPAQEHRVDGEEVAGQQVLASGFRNSPKVGPVFRGVGSMP